jgi:protein-S-isoprenylcysteine O-methyltransferase Ste14
MSMDWQTIRRVWLPVPVGLWALGVLFAKAPHDWLRWLGFFFALVGFVGVILSRYTLGRSFSVVPKATALVTNGIYSRIRNPIYISGMFCVAGALLMLRLRYLWIVFLLVIPIQIIRARREAEVLEAKFGDAYREYRSRTWF